MRARIVAQAASGLPPKYVLMTPVESVRRVLAKAGWTLADVDLFEINEAFSAQLVAVIDQLGLDPARVNVNGGAVALGHPIGASGARILTTLLYALEARGLRRGVAALCMGGGQRPGARHRARALSRQPQKPRARPPSPIARTASRRPRGRKSVSR